MRELKFRGKCIPEFPHPVAKWVYVSFVSGKLILYPYKERNQNRNFWYEVDPDTVGQFTGLKDKDGREIYEGDILQNKHARYILKYDEGEFIAVEITTRAVPDKTGWHWEEIEKSVQPLKDVLNNIIDDYKVLVVGNIHDNVIVRDGAR